MRARPTFGRRTGRAVAAVAVLGAWLALAPQPATSAPGDVVHRVNAGGAQLAGTPVWSADTAASPSPFVNAATAGTTTYGTGAAIDLTHPSVPAGTPAQLFQSERYDGPNAPEMQWNFPVTTGTRYEVRLYFAEIYAGSMSPGARRFDVVVDGQLALDDYDVFARAGAGNRAIVERIPITGDGNVDIDFVHVSQNPAIKAIEIVQAAAGGSGQLAAVPATVGFGQVPVNTAQVSTVEVVHTGAVGDPPVTVTATSISGADATSFSDSFDDASDVVLTAGSSAVLTVTYSPTTTGSDAASLAVSHSGSSSPLIVPLSGEAVTTAAISFGKSTLANESSDQITSLQFGPDDRLYVAQQNGVIKVYDVVRNGPNSYSATTVHTITSIHSMPNRNDDGTLNPSVVGRQVTGLLVVGTASNPVLYVGSSDPRIGGGSSTNNETGLDTNSGILSRLTWTGSTWQKLDLVRGLPRSEENHSPNGMQLDPATNILYLAEGGNTNMGAPSHNFALLPEYALSAAVLSIDLDAIGNATYDLPTLDDAARPGNPDANDPFGGNDGHNQARLVTGGPVQVFHAGFRNAYDLLRTESGRMYTIDNGANAGWGDVPIGEGPQGTCTNGVNEPGITDIDSFHLLHVNGYGGHPNPTRANRANTFSNPPQSPVDVANPVECDWRPPGPERGNITAYPASTNGLTEYTASNFGGQLRGDILAASFDNKIWRAKLNASGSQLVAGSALFQTVGAVPLDVVAQGDDDAYPGTVWVGDIGNGSIIVFEPADYGGGGGGGCNAADDPAIDADGDGFDNADEIDNGTNPCSAADLPPDRDADRTSDRNDTDDDNDGKPDTSDPFAIDPANGTTTAAPVRLTWDNDAPLPGGLANLGFTGVMTNGVADYQALFDTAKMTAGGAAGAATVDQVSNGDAYASQNSQEYGLQFGVTPPAGRFTAHTRVLSPFQGLVPQNYQSMGVFIGTGTQDDYAKLVVAANGGTGGVEFLEEVAASPVKRSVAAVSLPGPDAVDLYLTVDRATNTVQPSYTVTTGGVTSARTNLGGPEPIPASWSNGPAALAVGIISTSAGPAPPFPATWDLIEVTADSAPTNSLTAAPSTVSLTAAAGGSSTSSTVMVSASNGANPTLTASETATWLSVSPASTSAPGTFTLTANPTGLAAGTYNAVVTVAASGYASAQIPVTLTVTGNTSTYSLLVSTSSNRSNPRPLQGATVAGAIYAFTAPDTGVAKVRFYVDSPSATGPAYRTEGQAPYDLGGGNVSTANPYNTTGLADGTHTVTAAVDLTAGGTQLVHATFTVANSPTSSRWTTGPPLPVALGEVASGWIGGRLYVLGEGSPTTIAYDLAANAWISGLATRPHVGHHHGAEVLSGKLYLFGGLGGGSEGKVQIYDPATNTWSLGASMPFAAGSSSTAVIGAHVYVAGGIVTGATTGLAARYDPVANTWQSIATMPQGRNHAAAESDGTRMFVFGGRGVGSGSGNTVANGFDTVQIYDPATNSWVSSATAGSTIEPLPQARGGMGTAVFLQGELYVIGGETATGAGATASGVYSRVDIYNPATNTWRLGPSMPTARHGIFPSLHNGRIYVAGGGTASGFSASTAFEVLGPP